MYYRDVLICRSAVAINEQKQTRDILEVMELFARIKEEPAMLSGAISGHIGSKDRR